MDKLLEGLKSYFENTPKEQILKDWVATEDFDNGITCEEFFESNKQLLTNKYKGK